MRAGTNDANIRLAYAQFMREGKLAQTRTAFVETFIWNDGDKRAPWTPWGPAQRAREIIPGVRIYTTAGHGGMAVATDVARKMLSPTARSWAPAEKGFHWFEEDQDIAIPFYERPEWLKAIKPGVSPDHYEQKIRRTMPDYFEDLEKSSATKRTAKHPLDGVRRHQLLPANVVRKLPAIYSQSETDDPIVYVKLFSPYTNAVWYLTEYDPSDGQAFGWADLGMGGGELGYINIPELEGANKRGLPLVERDLYWKPMPLSKAKVSR